MEKRFTAAGMLVLLGLVICLTLGFYGCILLRSSIVRGGLLYDKWWEVLGVLDSTQPIGDHPLYPEEGEKSGPDTWRCKECHGWDYIGVDGAYGSGSHYTGIVGIYDSRGKSESELTDFLKTGTHDYSAYLSDKDIADIVTFMTAGLIDMNAYIDSSTKGANGDATNGKILYSGKGSCIFCHGIDGKSIDFGEGEGVGDHARDNPWETLHKIRFGNPGSIMPSAIDRGISVEEQIDILTYAQSLG